MIWQHFQKLSIPTQEYIQDKGVRCSPNNLSKKGDSTTTHNSPKLETSRVHLKVGCSNNDILIQWQIHGKENKQTVATCSSIDASRRQSMEHRKWHRKDHRAKLSHLHKAQKQVAPVNAQKMKIRKQVHL